MQAGWNTADFVSLGFSTTQLSSGSCLVLTKFKWPEPEDDSDRKLIRDVIEHKCHLIAIPADEDGPGYVFSVGLYLHFRHPEFILFGLDYR